MADLQAVQEWALVLDSQDIPNQIRRTPEGDWTLFVDLPFADRARAALQAYYEENAPEIQVADVPEYGRTWFALVVAGLLIVFFFITTPWSSGNGWLGAGAADGGLIKGGAWWRTVTALTLHIDITHVLSNAAALALFGTAVFVSFGPGLGFWLILASGAVGNLINALAHPAAHSGVGASTAVFGAVGILAGAQFARHRWHGRPGSMWSPILAALLLFALLGTSEYADVLAHVWGLGVGLGLGLVAGRVVTEVPGRWAQWVLAGAAGCAVVGCWWLALR
jgi:rhomboid protease GluP